MRRYAVLALALVLVMCVGCLAHTHKIGSGSQGMTQVQQRQWYILWGIVPLNNVDTNQMAGDSKNYEIKTEWSPLDFVINIFTEIVTVQSRTVTVKK